MNFRNIEALTIDIRYRSLLAVALISPQRKRSTWPKKWIVYEDTGNQGMRNILSELSDQ